jgi:hypothetical protein
MVAYVVAERISDSPPKVWNLVIALLLAEKGDNSPVPGVRLGWADCWNFRPDRGRSISLCGIAAGILA